MNYKTTIIMKNIFALFAIAFGLIQTTQAQVVTAVPCDMLGMSVNVGSQETSISIYHSGQYMTHPQPQKIFLCGSLQTNKETYYIKTL